MIYDNVALGAADASATFESRSVILVLANRDGATLASSRDGDASRLVPSGG